MTQLKLNTSADMDTPATTADQPAPSSSSKRGADQSPKISIIIAVYNGVSVIERCLQSIAAQTYPSIEVVVIDAGSTDGTTETLSRYDHLIDYWESRPDRGLHHAWNKALERITGDWVYFLGADDYLWAPDILARVADQLVVQAEETAVVFGDIVLVDEDGSNRVHRRYRWSGNRFRNYGMVIPHQGTFTRRELFDRHGPFDESFRISGCYDLLLRELKDHEAVKLDGLVIAAMQRGGLSSDYANKLRVYREYRRAHRKNATGKWPLRLWTKMAAAGVLVAASRVLSPKAIRPMHRLFESLTKEDTPVT